MVITVVCPSCATSFPVDPAKIPVGGVPARCTSCGEIFRVERPEETAAAVPGTSVAVVAPAMKVETREEDRPGDEEAAGPEDGSGDGEAGEEWGASADGPDEVEESERAAPGAAAPAADEPQAEAMPEGSGDVDLEEEPWAASLPGEPPASQAATESWVTGEEVDAEEVGWEPEAVEEVSGEAEAVEDVGHEPDEPAAHAEDDSSMDDDWAAWAHGDPTAVVEDAVEDAVEHAEVEEAAEETETGDAFDIEASAPLEGAGGGDEAWGATLPDAGIETDPSPDEDEAAPRWAAEPDDFGEEAVEEAEAMDWVFATDEEIESEGTTFGAEGVEEEDEEAGTDDPFGTAGADEDSADDGDAWMAESFEESPSAETTPEDGDEGMDLEEEALAGDHSTWGEPPDTAGNGESTVSGLEAAEPEPEVAEPESEVAEEAGGEEWGSAWSGPAGESGAVEEGGGGMVTEPPRAFTGEAVEEAAPEEAAPEEVHPEEAAHEGEPEVKGFSFGQRDPDDKARRLARVLVSDMIMYNPERHQRALKNGTLEEDFQEEMEKSWKEYVDQVGSEMAEGTDYWSSALNDILAKGENVF